MYLSDYGWYRVDARGNKAGVNAEFCPPVEQLAFAAVSRMEKDYTAIWAEPLPQVVYALTQYETVEQVFEHLPDDSELDLDLSVDGVNRFSCITSDKQILWLNA